MKSKRLALPIYLDKEPELYEWLREQAFLTKKDMTEIVRELIRQAKEAQK